MPSKLECLSSEQKEVLDKVVYKHTNLFFTGGGGTGKSFVLQCIIEELRYIHNDPEAIAVTASTGIAAFNIHGSTLHSFAGIGLGEGTEEQLYKKALFNKNACNRWKKVKVLIIDEISMISAELFDKLCFIASRIRSSQQPFGGIQLVLVGDLLQLPPVNTESTRKKLIFEADNWSKCIQEYVKLRKIFRQSDFEFIKTLAHIRLGVVPDHVMDYVLKLQAKKEFDDEGGVVQLYSTKNKANNFNKSMLNKLEGEIKLYFAKDIYMKSSKGNTNLLDSCQAPVELELKVGAQVMLVKNLTKDLVNGTVGIVTGFTEKLANTVPDITGQILTEPLPIVRFKMADNKTFTRPVKRELWESVTSSGIVQASRRQIPLILAWSITIHKSQSQTIQRLRVDVSDVFESGQIYTALSRAVDPNMLEVTGFDPDRIKVDEAALKFCMDNDLI